MAKQWSKAMTEANKISLKQRNYHEMIETQYVTMFPTSTESRAPSAARTEIEDREASEVKNLIAKLENLGVAGMKNKD
eukprot:8764545-Karenia_brevis.AAC.1